MATININPTSNMNKSLQSSSGSQVNCSNGTNLTIPTTFGAGVRTGSSFNYTARELLIRYSLDGIPSGSTITSAQHNIYISTYHNTAGSFVYKMGSSNNLDYGSTISADAAHWQNIAELSSLQVFASQSSTFWSSGTSRGFAITQAGDIAVIQHRLDNPGLYSTPNRYIDIVCYTQDIINTTYPVITDSESSFDGVGGILSITYGLPVSTTTLMLGSFF